MYVLPVLVLCLVVSLPQTPNKGDRVPHNNRTQKESVTPQQGLGASNFVYQPTIQGAEKQYDPYADRLYRAYLRATIIATIFSLIVIGMLIWQNILTRQTAEAASASADGLINSERAWVLADFDHPERPHTYYEFSLIFTNHGPTPARIESFFWDTKAIDSLDELPPEPIYGEAQYNGRLLAPKEPWIVDMIFPNAAISEDRWTEVAKDRNKYVICFGYVWYRGIFKGKRYTRFCFGYNLYLDRFTAVGPPAYNDYT